MLSTLIDAISETVALFQNLEAESDYSYSEDNLLFLTESLHLGPLDLLNLDLDNFTSRNIQALCRAFIRVAMFEWINNDILDVNDISELNIPKANIYQSFIDYCVYIKANSLEGVKIEYVDFLDTFLGTLELNNGNFNSIINHYEFSRYLVCLLQKLEIWNDFINGDEIFRKNSRTLGEDFYIKDELTFSELTLNNLHKLGTNFSKDEINTMLDNSISKLNRISNKEFEIGELIKTQGSNKTIYFTVTALALAVLYKLTVLFIINNNN